MHPVSYEFCKRHHLVVSFKYCIHEAINSSLFISLLAPAVLSKNSSLHSERDHLKWNFTCLHMRWCSFANLVWNPTIEKPTEPTSTCIPLLKLIRNAVHRSFPGFSCHRHLYFTTLEEFSLFSISDYFFSTCGAYT